METESDNSGAVQGMVWIVYDGTGAGSASITLLQVSVIREGSVLHRASVSAVQSSCVHHLHTVPFYDDWLWVKPGPPKVLHQLPE